jgi:hypothetical protein
VGSDSSNTVNTEFFNCGRWGRRTNQERSGFERIDARIVQRFGSGTNTFDVDSIDLMDLSD